MAYGLDSGIYEMNINIAVLNKVHLKTKTPGHFEG